jgi:predicted AlkP superfamily phosphohydrolase/phosphomutase
VLATRDLYPGERVDALPDLLIEWNREAPVSRIWSPRTGTIRATYRGVRTGDHRSEGLAFFAGPGFAPGRLGRPIAVEDFAPTLAGLVGVELPAGTGSPLEVHPGVRGGGAR